MTRSRLALALVLALAIDVSVASGASTAFADRVRLDGIAAIVGASSPGGDAILILHSDVDFDALLERARSGRVSEEALSSEERERARERLVGRALLVHEARRLRLDVVDEERRGLEARRFFARHGGSAVISAIESRIGLGASEVEDYIEADAIARGFALASAEQGGVVTEAEIEATWESGDHPFVGMDLESVRDPLRAFLIERRIEIESARFIERLGARVVVRRNRRS